MHRPDQSFIEQRWEQTALLGERLFTRIVEDKELIPKENLVEIGYGELVGDELEVLRRIYADLELPDWARFEVILKRYLESIKGYKVNKLEMDPKLVDFVHDRWRIVYDTYGYTKEYNP